MSSLPSSSRPKSLWGWGYADRHPPEDALDTLAQALPLLAGIAPGKRRTAATVDALSAPRSKMEPSPSVRSFCTVDPLERIQRARGRSFRDQVLGFEGDCSATPDVVALPQHEHQIQEVMEWCQRNNLALLPYGGGTSVVGGVDGACPPGYSGVVSLDLGRMNAVLEVDGVSLAARIAAGATGPHLEAQLKPHGLTLRHYPQSFVFSTLGGWLATRAGGHYATLRTRIDDFVESIRMVTPQGIWASRRLPASGAGPSPNALALGSEGIFGVITEAWMRVQERPRWKARATARFSSFLQGGEAVRRIVQSGLHPSNCRLIDAEEVALHGVGDGSATLLLMAFESPHHSQADLLHRAIRLVRDQGGTVQEGDIRIDEDSPPSSQEAWKDAFFQAPYLQSTLIRLSVIADTFETACTWDLFPSLHHHITSVMQEAMMKHCGGGRITCRLTHVYPDGPAPYFTFLAPGGERSLLIRWEILKEIAMKAVIDAGGTITHHHAVGRLHRPGHLRESPPLLPGTLRAMKTHLDPRGILNPGVLIDPLRE